MRFSSLLVLASLGLALAAPSLSLAAQQPAPAAAAARADGRAVVAEVRRIIAERYVFPDAGRHWTRSWRGPASGRYDVAEPGQLAERINADLDTAGHDRHLNFRYDPQAAAGMAARTERGVPDPAAMERHGAAPQSRRCRAQGPARQRPLSRL